MERLGIAMKKGIARRNFLFGTASIGMGAVLAGVSKTQASTGFAETKHPKQWEPFMDQYYNGASNIVSGIRDTQIDNIDRAMRKAYEVRQRGGSVYSQVVFGHYAGWAGAKDVPGQPWVLPQSSLMPKKEVYDRMKKGDFLITNRFYPDVKEVHDRGVYVVGVTTNYFRFAKTPPDGLTDLRNTWPVTEEVSDLVIDSQMPWDNGLVSAPQNPLFRICPSTGIAQLAVYWACTASLANLIGTNGKGSASEPARKYLDLVCDRFSLVGTDRPKIDRVTRIWADLVLDNHARFMVFGRPQNVEDYSSMNMFVADAWGAASGSRIGQGYDEKNVREHDIVLIGGLTSNDQMEVEVARSARGKKAYTAAFCPFSTEGDASGVRLFKEVDNAFNNYCDESAGVISVPGFKEKVSPISGLSGLLLHWMLMAQWTDHMAQRGEMPYYWRGMHVNGGTNYNEMVKPYFDKRGY
jgi:uncharacterized phosphosugar-binding protein